jgi:hypothetical protein
MAIAGTAFRFGAADEQLLAIASDGAAVRADAHNGSFRSLVHVLASPAGFALVGERSGEAFAWSEVRSITVSRGYVFVRTEAVRATVVRTKHGPEVRRSLEQRGHALRMMIDDVEEPGLSATFARVLDDLRGGTFTYHGTTWHDHANAIERLKDDFTDQDDAILPLAAAAMWVMLGLLMMLVLAVIVNVVAARAVPAGTFALAQRISPLDPRTIVASFAFSAMATTLVLRLALGRQAVVWARGAARGWHAHHGQARWLATRQLARILLGTATAAAITLLALLTFWLNVATTVFIDQEGVRNEVLLPFISIDERWRDAKDITRVTADDALDRPAVRIRFADGREVSTIGQQLGGGTEGQLFERANTWRAAALGLTPR